MKWFALLFFSLVAAFAQPATTTVADQFYTAVGPSYCTGYLTLTWVDFYSKDGYLIKGGTSPHIPVNATGQFSTSVVPTNTNTTPATGIYTAQYSLQPNNCAPGSEAWNVPSSGSPVNLNQVRTVPTPPPSLIPPASIAPPTSGPSTQAFCWFAGVVGWSSGCGGGGSGGTVTILTVANLSPLFTASVANPTSTPAVTFTGTSQNANVVLAGPASGGAAAYGFRTLVGADLPFPSATTLGGIESMTAISHRFINSISTLGVPGTAQPAFSDLTGSITCAQLPALTGDTTTTAGLCATTTSALNGGSVPASAKVMGTNSSAQPVAATAANVVGLFSTCFGTQYLGADGSCHTAGTGTVSSIATTSPIGGGTITTTGTITCTTCVTSATSLDSGRLVAGAGGQGLQNTDLSGDATTAGSTAVTVVGINGGLWPMSTTKVIGGNSSGQPVAATSADIISLWTSCFGSEYLGADGACHSAGGSGTVTSIATSSPITGGTITSTGTIACATCTTSAASLTSGHLLAGSGGQGMAIANLSGDASTSGSTVVTVTNVNGVAYGTSPSTNTVPVVTGTNAVTYEAVPNAALANSSTTIAAGTGVSVSGCGPVSLGGTCTVSGGTNSLIRTIGAGFDGAGSALTTTNAKVYFTVPFACTIAGWNITVDTGTITFDIWKIATGTAIPTISNTITASALPAISSGTAVHSTTLTGWTTSVAANDIFGIVINAVASATKASLTLQCSSS